MNDLIFQRKKKTLKPIRSKYGVSMRLFPQVQEGGTNQRGKGVGRWDDPLKIKQLCLWGDVLQFVSGACHITLVFPPFGNKQGVCVSEQRDSP